MGISIFPSSLFANIISVLKKLVQFTNKSRVIYRIAKLFEFLEPIRLGPYEWNINFLENVPIRKVPIRRKLQIESTYFFSTDLLGGVLVKGFILCSLFCLLFASSSSFRSL